VGPDWETQETILKINMAVDDLKEYDAELALNLQKRGNSLKADWQRKHEQEYAAWKEEDKQTTIKVSRERVILEITALTVLCGMAFSWASLEPDRGIPEPAEKGAIDEGYYLDIEDEPKPSTREGEP